MTVKDLIARLLDMDPNLPVYVWNEKEDQTEALRVKETSGAWLWPHRGREFRAVTIE